VRVVSWKRKVVAVEELGFLVPSSVPAWDLIE